jgi:UDP-N-acetylglucosamine:LPS N-acetylglucosamine transferase
VSSQPSRVRSRGSGGRDGPQRVLLVHSRVGGGHLSAARALAEQLLATGQATTSLVDAYLDCGRGPVRLFPAAYARLARHHPRLWSLLYHGSNRLNPNLVLRPLLKAGLRRVLRQAQPDVVISTLPMVNGALAEVVAEIGARLEVVLTDWHAIHRLWVARGVDYYTAPTDSARQDCINFGAPPDAVDTVGIPVRAVFAAHVSPRMAEGFTILAMVGAEGSPAALENIARLARLDLDARMVVLCGRNDELRRHIERLPAHLPLQAFGFVDNVADLMRSADVLVTKAGGLTLAEAFCCQVPVVVHDVLAGQEAGNLEYVLSHQAVEYAAQPEAMASIVASLYADPTRRAQLAERGAQLARPEAAARIARNVLERLEC